MGSMTDLESAWQDRCPSLSARLLWMLQKNLHTDVHFLVGHASSFSAHRIILASGSPVFETMFYGSCPKEKDSISVTDVHPVGFEFMLRYLYGENATFTSELEVCFTLFAAEKYRISGLRKLCYESIDAMKITIENVWEILEFSEGFHLEDLKKICLTFIEDNAKESLKSSQFLTMPRNIVELVLNRPLLRIKEIELLQMIADWFDNQDIDNSIDRQQIFNSLLCYIHFPSITKNEFNLFSQKRRNIFSASDKMALTTYYIHPDQGCLPSWCCLEGPRSGLVEKIPNILIKKDLKSIPYTSVISWFECQYKLEVNMTSYRDIQSVSLNWHNKPEDVPLFCDITLSWGKDSCQVSKNIEKRHASEEICIHFDKQLLNVKNNSYVVKVKVQFKYPLKVSFSNSSKSINLPIKCEFQRAFGVTQWKKKVIFSKAHCINSISMIRRK